MPFTTQAPAVEWSELWQNACEATSIYRINSFYAQDEIKRDEAVRHIKEIVGIKNKAFKVSADESLQKISDLSNALELPWTTVIKENPTTAELKVELSAHRPIIVPVYTPALQSSNYTSGGPDYHVRVMTGV